MTQRLSTACSRRQFVQGLALGGTAVSLGLLQTGIAHAGSTPGQAGDLRGTDLSLTIAETPVNLTGRTRIATTVNGGVPGPVLRLREGETVTLRVTNQLSVPTSIHWHGLILPANMDGVPGLSFDGIPPGQTFTYRFPLRQSGTYWYHSHSRFQEQTGLYGALVIDPAEERCPVDREHVLLLSDWSDEDPEHIYRTLKKMSGYYNFNKPTAIDFLRDVRMHGLREAVGMRRMLNEMRMSPADFGDVSAYTYTYLLNGMTPAGNWTGLFRPGEKVKLRVINASSQTIFDVRIPGLKLTVVAADGQPVEPVSVDEFRISVAETYDVIVEPQDDRAYTVFAQSMDRSGYVRGTLAPRAGMQAEVPVVDKPVWLDMRDMMGDMGGSRNHGGQDNMPDMDMSGMDMSQHAGHGQRPVPAVHHASTEYGPNVDVRVDTPRSNLDDPGAGLRDNGRRVLTYADLRTVGGSIDPREPSREIELHLTGNMERFIWSFDGLKSSEAGPIHLRHGERVRITLVNDSMMNHPIHLHGMWSELESPDGSFQVRKHTINVQPSQRVSYAVSADALGRWAYHCHLLYHMEAGMFREVVVS